MPDWSKSMKQRYEYYVVDPETWGDTIPLDCVTTCTVMRDAEAETLGSASFNVTKDLAEHYIRVYLVTDQNGVTERFCLGTFLASAPSYDYNGTTKSMQMDGYTPLIELKENQPPLGYSLMKEESIMAMASALTDENMRGPVVSIDGAGRKTLYDNFVANTDDTWLSFIKDLILMDEHKFALDDYSRVLFDPVVPLDKMQPIYIYDTDNSSILYPDLTIERDFYGIPNVVEVYAQSEDGPISARVENTLATSPVSIQNRGREIVKRYVNPQLSGTPTEDSLRDYATQMLQQLSTLVYTVSYKHGFTDLVRLGDCVRLNYPEAGLDGVNAVVINQNITCKPGCEVSERAQFTRTYWEGG